MQSSRTINVLPWFKTNVSCFTGAVRSLGTCVQSLAGMVKTSSDEFRLPTKKKTNYDKQLFAFAHSRRTAA